MKVLEGAVDSDQPTQTFAAGWNREFDSANEAVDRKERCLDAHGYGCARPECGRSAVNPDDVVGLTNFTPQTEGDPPA